MTKNTRRIELACYATNICMAIIGNLPPILFLTFRSLYGISYSMLGLLVLINFSSQLAIDLIFSFFSHRFNIPRAVKAAPAFTLLGLAVYAVWPILLPQTIYPGLVIGTVISSIGSGFAEVLITPVIAALHPNDDRAISALHSVYAWGAVGVILIASLFLLCFGGENWTYLALLFLLVPLYGTVQFARAELPPMQTPERVSGALHLLRNPALILCVAAIFLGGSAECSMAQWASGYLEQALGIPKAVGDIFGVALFGMMLGLGRTLYTRFGRCISRVLLLGAIGAAACYLTVALCGIPLVGLAACALTGFCVSMLWPGSLIVASDRISSGGVFVYAIMAAGGDLGAAVGPQLIGIITDAAIASPTAAALAARLALSPEQFGMKLAMLVGMLFPLAAIPVFAVIHRTAKRHAAEA